jgi:hypothetical protein
MKLASALLMIALATSLVFASDTPVRKAASKPASTVEEFLLPANYRTWVALSPGTPGMPQHYHSHMVSKIYVEPSAYEQFGQKGEWPDKTVIVLEIRSVKQSKKGANDLAGLEAAVKDDSRFPDLWNYYGTVYNSNAPSPKALMARGCADSDEPLDMMLAMAFPTLRAVINAKPKTVSPSIM